MDSNEAKALLREHLQLYRLRTYTELVALMGQPQVAELESPSGAKYQVGVEVHWDHRPGGAIRVLGLIDDGGWRAFKPTCDDFILAANGTFVGE